MPVIRLFLYPFSLLYGWITELRNRLYDRGIIKSFQFEPKVIGIGNLTVGGTGKTPMVEYITGLLVNDYRIALLSRGYKRSTKGVRIAGEADDARSIGDEPFQYYLKFGQSAIVAVGEDRALAIPHILFEHPDVNLIILDDAYQHRSVVPDLNILLTDFNRPFYSDHLLPSGRLRERRRHARRADMVVVTKCPDPLSEHQVGEIAGNIRRYASMNSPLYFSTIEYLKPIPVFPGSTMPDNVKKIFFFSGIASDASVKAYARVRYEVVEWLRFSDHFRYTIGILERKISNAYRAMNDPEVVLMTTEKDMARIVSVDGARQLFKDVPLLYLPIKMRIMEKEGDFNRTLTDMIRQGNRRNSL